MTTATPLDERIDFIDLTPEVPDWPDLTGMTGTQKLRATYDFIVTHPDLHDQGSWFSPKDESASTSACGTTACLAGWGAALAGGRYASAKAVRLWNEWYTAPTEEACPLEAHSGDEVLLDGLWMTVSGAACSVFDLDSQWASWLFAGDRSVEDMGLGIEAIENDVSYQRFLGDFNSREDDDWEPNEYHA